MFEEQSFCAMVYVCLSLWEVNYINYIQITNINIEFGRVRSDVHYAVVYVMQYGLNYASFTLCLSSN